MITSLLNWWTEQMRDLVPASLRSAPGHRWRPELGSSFARDAGTFGGASVLRIGRMLFKEKPLRRTFQDHEDTPRLIPFAGKGGGGQVP